MIIYEKLEVCDIFSTQTMFQFYKKQPWKEMEDTFTLTLQVYIIFHIHGTLNQGDAV